MGERGGWAGEGRGGERGLLGPLSAREGGGHGGVEGGAIERPMPGQDGGWQRLLGEHRVHQRRPRLQRRSVTGGVRPSGHHAGRDGRRR